LEKYVSLVHHPEEMLRDVSRAYTCSSGLLRLGRVQEAKRALASSQRYREAKFRYDAKHTFDEQPSATAPIAAHPSAIAGLLETCGA